MAGPAPSWNTIPVTAKYRKIDGSPHSGKVVFTIMARVTSTTDDIIFPKNSKLEATLNGLGAISITEFPAVDDPDNFPEMWSIKVEEILTDGGGETYYIQPLMSMTSGLDLGSVLIEQSLTLDSAILRGVAGGVAGLNNMGNVIDAFGVEVSAFDPSSYYNKASIDAAFAANQSADRARANHTGTQSADTIVDGSTNKTYTGTERTKLQGIATGATVNSSDSVLLDRANHTGTQSADTIIDGSTNKAFTATEKTKLGTIATAATANSSDATLLARANHTGTQSADTVVDGTTNKAYTATEKTKLAGVATGATANDTDANLKARANHTGTQTADTLTDGTTNKAFLATERTKLTGIATGATANSSDATLLARANHTGTQSADTLTDGTTNKAFLATERTKLTGVATGATANDTDANLKARANHTGTQLASTISDFSTAADARITAAKGVASGIAGLDTNSKLQPSNFPTLQYANLAAFPATGASNLQYLAQDTNYPYRWTGSAYVRTGATVQADISGLVTALSDITSDIAARALSTDVASSLALKANVADIPSSLRVRTSADIAGTPSSTAFGNVGSGANLIGIPMLANEEWDFEIVMYIVGNSTADIVFQFTGPTGTTLAARSIGPSSGSGAITGGVKQEAMTALSTPSAPTGLIDGTTISCVVIGGWVKCSTTAGTFQLQAAQSVSNATAHTIKAGSTLMAVRKV